MTWLFLLLLCLPTAGWADEVRVGLFVGNNDGHPSDQQLLFADADAKKMHDLFVSLGGMSSGNAVLVQDATRRSVEHGMDQVHRKVVDARNAGHHTTLVFYYSGHGDDRGLHLGPAELEHAELRRMLDRTDADVRLALLDACQSGGAVRTKGGQRGPAFDFAIEVEQTRGTAFLTSSAASELSQESTEVGGGFFTHYLHTALAGAADRNRDGEVTLTEAYAFVHTETAFGTLETRGAQTPTYDFDLVGSSEVVLTTLEAATAHLDFQGGLEGTLSVWDENRKRYVAEIGGARPLTLSLRPGTYYVHQRQPAWVEEARYDLRKGETLAVLPEDFTSVAYEETAARGDIDRQIRRARTPRLSLRMVLGGRGLAGEWSETYLPPQTVAGIEARFLRKTGRTWFAFDILSGTGEGDLSFDALTDVHVTVSSTSGGASIGFATGPGIIRAGLGARAELATFGRSFPDGQLPDQRSYSLSPGLSGWAGVHLGRFSTDLAFNLLIMSNNWDDRGNPVYGELLWLTGYRF